MNNDTMKILAEQIGALVITNANMAARIASLETEIENLKSQLSENGGK